MSNLITQTNTADDLKVRIPAGARAAIVSVTHDGKTSVQPVFQGESVLNIENDLINHLSATPYSDEWLMELKSYVAARLDARTAARKSGGVAVPEDRTWRVVHGGQLFSDVEVRA